MLHIHKLEACGFIVSFWFFLICFGYTWLTRLFAEKWVAKLLCPHPLQYVKFVPSRCRTPPRLFVIVMDRILRCSWRGEMAHFCSQILIQYCWLLLHCQQPWECHIGSLYSSWKPISFHKMVASPLRSMQKQFMITELSIRPELESNTHKHFVPVLTLIFQVTVLYLLLLLSTPYICRPLSQHHNTDFNVITHSGHRKTKHRKETMAGQNDL